MQALVLEGTNQLAIRDVVAERALQPHEVRIAVKNVGICGSDLHYYRHGRIGPFVVERPMVLGHEAAGTVTEVGAAVTQLQKGDRVCMEPGIPNPRSRAARNGQYNLDPEVNFWATPPIDGCLMPEVIHPADYTFRLPDGVSHEIGALVEPLATGMQAADKARIRPGDTAVVVGAGTIGIMTALSALAGGCSRVIIADLMTEKLAVAGRYPGLIPINITERSLSERVMTLTDGWGAEQIFEASGSPKAYGGLPTLACPGGCLVLVGMPSEPVSLNIVEIQAKELRIESVFRYANQFPRALALLGTERIDLKPLVSGVYPFSQAIAAFERAAASNPGDIKIQIQF